MAAARMIERPVEQVLDDRHNILPDDAVLLIVEDDPHYARIIVDLARDNGLKVLVAMTGAEALALAREYQPMAVSLDVFLPDMLGWTVLSQLKQNPTTRHIPVQIVTLDEDRQHGLARGAFSFLTKPTTTEGLEAALTRIKDYAKPRRKRLLVVEDSVAEQLSVTELLGHDDIDIESVGTGAEALAVNGAEPAGLRRARPAPARHDRLRRARADPRECQPERPAGRRLHRPRAVARRGTPSCTRSRAAWSSRVSSPRNGCSTRPRCSCTAWWRTCRPTSSSCSSGLHNSDEDLIGRTVLLVDDDARNIFAAVERARAARHCAC